MSALSAFGDTIGLTDCTKSLILQRYVQSRKRDQMSALVSKKGADPRREAFLAAILVHGQPGKAALEAGYSHGSYGTALLRDPSTLALLHVAVQKSLAADAPNNLRVLRHLRDDVSTPARVRADVSLQLSKMAGHVVPSNKADAPGKQLSEMTQAEMLDYIERNQAEIDRAVDELAARATPLNAQVSAQDQRVVEAKPLNYLD